MKYRKLALCLLTFNFAAFATCRPVTSGFATGIEDGLAAGTAAVFGAFATEFLDNILPGDDGGA
jgi:hypothetical protein